MELPDASEKRLVDTGMLHYEASVAGFNERYRRGETSHTIHVWWARRPHSAMRSLVFASVCKDTTSEAVQTMADLAMLNDVQTLEKAQHHICNGYEEKPKVLDMFGGGGTIPFESKRLGLDTYSIDSNQLSVFIQKCNMLYAEQIDMKNAEKCVKETGIRILNNVKQKTEWLYPLRKLSQEKVFGYLWSYSTVCSECGYRFYLIKRPWLSKKKGKRLSFIGEHTDSSEIIKIKELSQSESYETAWGKGMGIVHCPKCSNRNEKIDITECEDVLLATISTRDSSGKEFSTLIEGSLPNIKDIDKAEKQLLMESGIELPISELPLWSGIVNPAIYGIKTHSDFLNRRQRLLLLYLINELITEYNRLKLDDEIMAKFVIGVLSSLIDQVVDWNCRLSMWIPQNEQVGRGFCGPGIAMLWDYAETDQLLRGPANLWDKLNRILKGIKSFEHSKGNISVEHAHAQRLPYADNFFDAIITDPPYYDNIYYSILADFFYAWKKPLLEKVEPDLFKADITDYKYELVASARRAGDTQAAHESYCVELKKAFNEAARVIKDNGVFSFIYSHSSVNGWDAIIQSYRHSPFFITSVQPLSIERKGRPRAFMSEAVNTCVTFVARKSSQKRIEISLDELLQKTLDIVENFGKPLIVKSGWCEADAALATLAYTIGIIANASKVNDALDDKQAIITISKVIKQHFPSFTIKTRDSL